MWSKQRKMLHGSEIILECEHLGRVNHGQHKDHCLHKDAPTTDGYDRICIPSKCPVIKNRELVV